MVLALLALNFLFFAFHTLLVLFNMFGWMSKRWRRWHLVAVLATAFSWCVMGLWKGMGYCILTDWHWQVRDRLGYPGADSYIQLMIRDFTGVTVNSVVLNPMIEWTFIACGVLSILLNLRDYVCGIKQAKQAQQLG